MNVVFVYIGDGYFRAEERVLPKSKRVVRTLIQCRVYKLRWEK